MVKVRKVLYTSKGYEQGEYLGEFPGTMLDVFNKFSELWMAHSSDGNELKSSITDEDAEYVDEFTFCGEENFCVGVRNGILYEGINSTYEPYPGMEVDSHGFEVMKDMDGKLIPYKKVIHS